MRSGFYYYLKHEIEEINYCEIGFDDCVKHVVVEMNYCEISC